VFRTFPELVWRSVQNLAEIGLAVRACKRDTSTWVGTKWLFYINTSQPCPGAAREKFDELTSTTWTFYVTQSFLSRDPFGFWSLGYPGSGGQVGGIMLVLITFPELVVRKILFYYPRLSLQRKE